MWRERIRARSGGNWFIFFFLLFFWDYNLLLKRDGVDGEIGVDGETDRDGRSGGLRSLWGVRNFAATRYFCKRTKCDVY